MDIKQIVLDLCALSDEQEWFEFKENWFQPEALGEYVSALSNAAAFHYKKYAYFIWGVNDKTHEIAFIFLEPISFTPTFDEYFIKEDCGWRYFYFLTKF